MTLTIDPRVTSPTFCSWPTRSCGPPGVDADSAAKKSQARLPCHPAGNRAHFLKRLPEAVPDIGDVERIDIAKPGTARYPSYAGRTLRGRW